MVDHATVKKLEYFKMTILMVFLVLLAGAHGEDLSGTADAPSASTAPPPERVLQPTRESIYRHLAAELQHALGAEEHIKGVFAGLAAGIDDSVTVTVVPSLQALIDSVVERAEDAWVAADDAGRTVDVKVCVDGAENDAQQVAKRALEKMRGCLDALEQEGKRRSREAARLLVEIEGISKRFISALETCVKDEETKDATKPAGDDMNPSVATTTPVADVDAAAPTNTADTAVTDTRSEDTVPEFKVAEPSCAKNGAEEVAETGQAKCSKCKKTMVASEEDLAASQEEVLTQESLEPKRKCKEEKCEKLKGKTDVKTGGRMSEGEVKKQKDGKKKDGHQKQKKGNVDEESLEGGGDGEAQVVESDTGSLEKLHKKAKHGNKIQKHEMGLKNKEKSKKGEKYESSNMEEIGAEASGHGSMDGKDKKKNKKQKVKSRETQSTENDNVEESLESNNNEHTNGEGKHKKEKKSGKKDEGKTKGKKDKTRDESSEGKARRKRDLLPFQENIDIDSTENDLSQQVSSEQPVDNTASNSDANTAPKWPTEGSSPEEKYVITCMGSTVMKPLIDEKNRVYQKLQGMLQRVRDKEQEAPAQCVTDHVRKAELKITAIKTRMASCADRKMRQDL